VADWFDADWVTVVGSRPLLSKRGLKSWNRRLLQKLSLDSGLVDN
jgi:hypothetical protein